MNEHVRFRFVGNDDDLMLSAGTISVQVLVSRVDFSQSGLQFRYETLAHVDSLYLNSGSEEGGTLV